MTFVRFSNNAFTYTLVYVEIDYTNKLIRRTFDGKLPTTSGHINPYNQTDLQITKCFQNEIYWLKVLENTKYVPKLVDVDIDKQHIVQEYYEPSLLLTGKRPQVDEVVELYRFFKTHGINKCNGSLSNMCYNNDQLIAFDFKHAQYRPAGELKEFRSYKEWLSKIDNTLTSILTEMYYDTKT